jgi:hypothetical protein
MVRDEGKAIRRRPNPHHSCLYFKNELSNEEPFAYLRICKRVLLEQWFVCLAQVHPGLGFEKLNDELIQLVPTLPS